MNWKTSIPLVIAILLGGVAAKVAVDMANGKKTKPVAVSLKLVTAKVAIAPGSELTSDQLQLVPASTEHAPAGAYTALQDVVGRVVTVPLTAGQTISEGLLAPVGSAAGLQALLPMGSRAITVEVNETSGLAGLLAPGARVDIVSTLLGSEPDKTISRTIAENLPVVAVGPRMSPTRQEGDKDSNGYHTVTLTVTPHQAELIELASSTARTRLVLRARGDNNPIDPAGVTAVELRGRQRLAPDSLPVLQANSPATTRPTTQPAPVWTALIVHGSNVSSVDYEIPAAATPVLSDTDPRPALQP